MLHMCSIRNGTSSCTQTLTGLTSDRNAQHAEVRACMLVTAAAHIMFQTSGVQIKLQRSGILSIRYCASSTTI